MLFGMIAVVAAVAATVLCNAVDAFSNLNWLWLLPFGFAGGFVVVLILTLAFVYLACQTINQDVPQEKDSPFFRGLAGLLAEAVLIAGRVHIHTTGLEKTPKQGRFLLVCNHLHEADPVILLRYFRKSQLAFISKQENKDMFLVGKLMHKLQCQLVNRENDREALKTILKCIQIIKEDKASIAVFPEGYIRPDRKFHHFRPGVFKIAQKAKVPIVVCTIRDTQKIIPNFLKGKASKVELHLLEVIPPSELEGKTTVEIADRIHGVMAWDLGPDYEPVEST